MLSTVAIHAPRNSRGTSGISVYGDVNLYVREGLIVTTSSGLDKPGISGFPGSLGSACSLGLSGFSPVITGLGDEHPQRIVTIINIHAHSEALREQQKTGRKENVLFISKIVLCYVPLFFLSKIDQQILFATIFMRPLQNPTESLGFWMTDKIHPDINIKKLRHFQ